jgi:hypothetical protein
MPKPVETVARRVRRYKLDEYLKSQRCTLWPGVGFDVTDEKERAMAVEFLEQLLDGLG